MFSGSYTSRPLRLFFVWGPAAGLMATIYVASGRTDVPQSLAAIPDVILHAVAYAVLGAAMLRGLAGGRRAGVTVRTAVLAAGLTLAYGVADEFHQSFVPGRHAQFRDVIADAVGATAGAALGFASSMIPSVQAGRRTD